MALDADVVVVGAGLCGLVIAGECACQGLDIAVLEATDRIGGRIRTITFDDGVTAEAGMEEFWQDSPAYPLLCRLGLPLREDNAHSSVILTGSLTAFPSGGSAEEFLDRLFTTTERSALARWYAFVERVLTMPEAPGTERDDDLLRRLRTTSLPSVLAAVVDQPRVATWLRVLIEAETAIDAGSISALDGIAEFRAFLPTPEWLGQRNAHVEGGNDRLVRSLADRLPPGTIRTGSRVIAVDDLRDHVRIELRAPDGRVREIRTGQVVLTAPAWALRRIRLSLTSRRVVPAALATVRAGSYVKVVLRLCPDAGRLWAEPGNSLFTLLTDSPAGCIYLTDPAGEYAGADHVMTLLIHGPAARELAGRSEGEIIRRGIAALARLAVCGPAGRPQVLLPGIASLVTQARAFDHPLAVAYWPVRHRRSRFDSLADALRRPHGRVHFAGDTTESSHSDGAVRSALRVVAQLTSPQMSTASPFDQHGTRHPEAIE